MGGVEAFVSAGIIGPGQVEADSWVIVGICCVVLGKMGGEVGFGSFVFGSIWFPNLSLKACV